MTDVRQDLDNRINQVEQLLQELKQEKQLIDQDKTPKPGEPLDVHLQDLGRRAGLNEGDYTYRTLDSGVEKPIGLNKTGVRKINEVMKQYEDRLEEVEGGVENKNKGK